ncbi:MAG: recombinase family protein [Oscillospiraceae bacterium]|nr:recombinase family protein [Oscillospiraceae bacterium]
MHTIKRCTQTQPSGCILGASFDCINKPLNGDIVLQLLSYVAETERKFIRQRQAEGIAAAKARGVRFGRRPMERPPQFTELFNRWERGEISAATF